MQKLLPVFLGAIVLSGCMGGTKQDVDWTKGNGCEKYFSNSARDMANCQSFVKAQEAAEQAKMAQAPQKAQGPGTVGLEPAGDKVRMTQGMKEAENFDRILTE